MYFSTPLMETPMKIRAILVFFILSPFSGCLQETIEIDTDNDGISDILDEDDDNDGIPDSIDHFPLNSSENHDLDDDGVGDNSDIDIDGDGWENTVENLCGKDPRDSSSYPLDKDNDSICDFIDPDLEGLLDEIRSFSFKEWQMFSGEDSESYALNISTWQLSDGGWRKNNFEAYKSRWEGVDPFPNTTFANQQTLADKSTTGDIRFLASQFLLSSSEENRTIMKNSIDNGIQFILDSQHPSGGWPLVYPFYECNGCNYSNLMTFNDHVIGSAILLLWDISEKRWPFFDEVIEGIDLLEVSHSLNLAIDYVLSSQVIVNGTPTIWGQQHHPFSFESLPARSWEKSCRTPNESYFITTILLNWPDRSEEITKATWGAVRWYEDNAINNSKFDYGLGEIIESPGELLWFRYYNVSDDQYFFADSNSTKVFDLDELSIKSRTTYLWAGNWGQRIIEETSKISDESRG